MAVPRCFLRDRRRPAGGRFPGSLAAVLGVAVLLAGCGGSETKQNFAARADAICASTVRQIRSIAPPNFTSSKAQQLSALGGYMAVVSPIVASEAKQLHALQRPAGSARARAALTRYLDALTQTAGDYQTLAAAAKRGDAQGVANAEGALRTSDVTALAQSYGLRSCGTPGATVG
jgi:hypothetical protein